MKNLEKCVDWIAELVGHFVDCQKCPCHNYCLMYDNECSCKEFFKRWAMKEVEENGQANKTK